MTKPKYRQKWCYIFVDFSLTPTSVLKLTISSESQWNIDSNDILSTRKYSQLVTHKSNTFITNNTWFCPLRYNLARVPACCCDEAKTSSEMVLHFCTFLLNPTLWYWTWLCHQKANKSTFPTICCPYGNILNFSRMSRIHTIRHSTHSN